MNVLVVLVSRYILNEKKVLFIKTKTKTKKGQNGASCFDLVNGFL